ncbi:hypothetical protein ACFQDD_06620, partial [Halorubrum pallidum]
MSLLSRLRARSCRGETEAGARPRVSSSVDGDIDVVADRGSDEPDETESLDQRHASGDGPDQVSA